MTIALLPLAPLGCGDDEPASTSVGGGAATSGTTVSSGGGGAAPNGPPFPDLTASAPESGATIARTAWIVLSFATPVDAAALGGLDLICEDAPVELDASILDGTRVVINPRGELPPGSACTLGWRDASGDRTLEVTVAPVGEPAIVPYDRSDESRLGPLPDDWYLAVDDSTATGHRLALTVPDRPAGVKTILSALIEPTKSLDGQSPLAPIIIDVPVGLDPSTLPSSFAASLDPLATLAVIDVLPSSPTYLQRVPFQVQQKTGENTDGTLESQLVLFTGVALQPRGVYAVVVTNRLLVDPSRPLEASEFMAAALAPASDRSGEAAVVGAITDGVLGSLAEAEPPIFADDVALVLRTSIRSMDHVADDRLALRDAIDAMAPPEVSVATITEGDATSAVAAVVRGTWRAPQWRDGAYMARDDEGRPRRTDDVDIPFVLALPREPVGDAGAPLIVYQHGWPGDADHEVPLLADLHYAEAGFAVIGFVDPLNRENADLAALNEAIFTSAVVGRRFPDTMFILPNAEQMAFVRMIENLVTLDVLPVDAPDGSPDLDLSRPLGYVGISAGAAHGAGLLPLTPAIGSAALVVGGGRFSSWIIHQDDPSTASGASTYDFVTSVFPDVTRSEFLNGLSIVQASVDDQDPLNMARFLLREPLAIDGSGRTHVLLTEALGDTFVPASSTAATANAFGLEHLGPVQRETPFLEVSEEPLQGNLEGDVTGAFHQFVAAGQDGIAPTPGCEEEPEGHACAQKAPAAVAQRLHFLTTALAGAPEAAP